MEHAQTCQSPPDVVAVMTQSLMTKQPASPPDVYSIAFMTKSQHGLHERTGMSVPKNVAFLAFSLAHRPQRDQPSLFCFLSRFLMAACFHEKWMETREITKRRKEDKAKAKAQGEPSSKPRCLGALRSPENSESTKRKKTAKSLATKKPRMDNPDNSVSSPSAKGFSTALESDITQLDDRFDVSRQEKLAQSGEQLLKMIVDVATIFNDIPSSCYPENENAKGASWAERMENMDSLWEGVRESVYNNFLSKQAYPLVAFLRRRIQVLEVENRSLYRKIDDMEKKIAEHNKVNAKRPRTSHLLVR
ncbi:hypothetical protein DAPPUDRAFT_306739 [Daphnia pulex]|uniref:Uncharacterized protein n=1 Tax=Daphnia pulex TaxID=6669 RepID=E9I523_DAPPU|nr:hypothetical protein DAPPUDRAFT_306739 [Daphnia pulex]|eukprot:EFX60907.1 hypothetical protein DAPPUDRAFT_306739 [Daphnia pulex]